MMQGAVLHSTVYSKVYLFVHLLTVTRRVGLLFLSIELTDRLTVNVMETYLTMQ